MDDPQAAAARFRIALELHDLGMKIMRQNIRRANPEAFEAEIDAKFRAWLLDRPMDAPGRVVPWPRERKP